MNSALLTSSGPFGAESRISDLDELVEPSCEKKGHKEVEKAFVDGNHYFDLNTAAETLDGLTETESAEKGDRIDMLRPNSGTKHLNRLNGAEI